MSHVMIWDLPVRLFHGVLVLAFAGAAGIAFLLDDHHPAFAYHAMLGLTLAALLVLRIVWGLAGTRHARFASMPFSPLSLFAYFKGIATGRGERHAGHNPATSWLILVLIGLNAGMTITGVRMGLGVRGIKDIHEFLGYALLAVVGGHIAGVLLHTIRYRENIIAGMVHGRKRAAATDAIDSPRPLAAIVLVMLLAGWAGLLLSRYDAPRRRLSVPFTGVTLKLGDEPRGERDGSERPLGSDRPERDRD